MGRINTASGQYGNIGGGRCNTAGQHASVSGGYFNTALNNFSFIGGGQQNCVCGGLTDSSIVGGCLNKNCQGCSIIGGGWNNCLTGSTGFSGILSGGANCVVSGGIAFIGSGCKNFIRCANHSAIVNGCSNTIDCGASCGLIGNGEQNSIRCCSPYSSIQNGCLNLICINQSFGFIANGQSNCINGANGFIGNGCLNTINNEHEFVGNGVNNAMNGAFGSIINGESNSNDGNYSTIINGNYNCITSSGYFGTSSGTLTLNERWGQRVHANHNFNGNAGNGQHFELVAYVQVVDDTPVSMLLDGGSLPIETRDDTAISVNIKTLGTTNDFRQISSDVFAVFYNTGGTLTMSHCERYAHHVGSGFSPNDLEVQATNNCIDILVAGQANKNTRFVSYITGIEYEIPPDP